MPAASKAPAPVEAASDSRPAAAVDTAAQPSYEERKRQEAEARRVRKVEGAKKKRIDELEARIAEREREIKEIEAQMAAPGFYDDRELSRPVIDRHQALMWEVGDLMGQWEALQ